MTDDQEQPGDPAPRTGQDELDLNFHTDIPVGEILRRTRMHYDQTLPQIESVLRIRASQLEALEKGDISQLPGRVYAIGFVRSYSEYLGLDGDKMVQLFKEQSVGRQKKPDLSFAAPAAESKAPGKGAVAAGIAGAIGLIVVLAVFILPTRDKTEIPPVPSELSRSQLNEAPALIGSAGPENATASPPATAANTPAAPAADDAVAVPSSAAAPAAAGQTAAVSPQGQSQQVAGGQAPSQAQAGKPPSNRIVLEITDSSWVEIKNPRGAVLLRQVLKPGDMFLVPNEEGLVMATGNAGGIRVKVDGREVASRLGETGQIKRNVLLDPAAFGVSP